MQPTASPKRRSLHSYRTLVLVIALPALSTTGCLSLLSASRSTASEVKRVSRFDSGCSSMRIVHRSGRRFKLRGCEQEAIYQCAKLTTTRRGYGHRHRHRKRSKASKTLSALDALLIGPSVTEIACRLVASRRLYAPKPRGRAPNADSWPQPTETPTPIAAVKKTMGKKTMEKRTGDEPGVVISAAAPKTAGAVARIPDGRDVMSAIQRVEPALRRCAGSRARTQATLAKVSLRVAKNGRVLRAEVTAAELSASTRLCLARALQTAKLPAASAGPLTLATMLRVR